MSKKLPKILMAGVAACMLFAAMSSTTLVFADNVPIQKAGPNGATISEEVDEATNKDPEMSTEFWLYLEPDPVIQDVPLMGDAQPSLKTLIGRAALIGTILIGVQGYVVYEKQKEHKDILCECN